MRFLVIISAMRIYTKTGDLGKTSLFGGERVEKDSARINAYGTVDELNSLIGVVIAELNMPLRGLKARSNLSSSHSRPDRESSVKIDSRFRGNDKYKNMEKKLLRLQSELFVLGGDLATPISAKVNVPRIPKSFVVRLEREIDYWSLKLPQLRNFILPGGSVVGSHLHLARTIARRAERAVVALARTEKISKNDLIYINRLSDWFFTLARYANKLDGDREVVWKGRG